MVNRWSRSSRRLSTGSSGAGWRAARYWKTRILFSGSWWKRISARRPLSVREGEDDRLQTRQRGGERLLAGQHDGEPVGARSRHGLGELGDPRDPGHHREARLLGDGLVEGPEAKPQTRDECSGLVLPTELGAEKGQHPAGRAARRRALERLQAQVSGAGLRTSPTPLAR